MGRGKQTPWFILGVQHSELGARSPSRGEAGGQEGVSQNSDPLLRLCAVERLPVAAVTGPAREALTRLPRRMCFPEGLSSGAD